MMVPLMIGFGLFLCPETTLDALTVFGRFLLWLTMLTFIGVAILG